MNIRIPGLEGIDIDKVLGRAPKRKAVDRKIKLSPKQKKKITAKPRRISTPMGEINIPGMGGIAPRPRPKPKPPLNKARPKPKPSGSVPNKVEMSKALKDFSNQVKSRPSSERPPVLGSIPGTGEIGMINIPGVGPIQLPTPQSPAKTETDSIAFPDPFANETDPNLSELDRLKNQYDRLTGMRSFRDPGPGHFNEIKELAQQIYGLDNTFESPYLQDDPYAGYRNREDDDDEDTPPVDFQSPSEYLSEQEMENITTPNPSLTEEQLRQLYTSGMMDYDDDYFTDTEGMFGEAGQRYGLGVNQDRIDEIAGEINFSSNQADTEEESPAPTPAPTPPPKPVNPFEGYVPRNIIGPSFDPKDVSAQQKMVADARARQTPGANIQGGGYLTYDNPLLGNKQTQFGGYGQPMPTAPLMNYAGLASPTTYSKPPPDPDKEIIR